MMRWKALHRRASVMKAGVAEAFAHTAMAAIGTKRTSLFAPHMSAIGSKADIAFCTAHVRL